MYTQEWALLTFTILGQMAVGALLVIMVVHVYVSSKAGIKEADRMTDGPLFIVVPIMGLALLASLLHLNNPGNIFGAVPNLGSSWMSREVVLAVAFVVLAALFTFLQWRKISSTGLRSVIGWITVVVGLVQTYAMGMVYMIRTQPAWNTFATPVTFFVTTLLLGALAVMVALVINYSVNLKKADSADKQMELLHSILQGTTVSAIVLLGIEFLVYPIYLAYLATQGTAALESVKMMTGSYGATLFIRLLLVFIGAGVLTAFMLRNASMNREKVMSYLVYSAFVLVLVGEVMGRFLFYAAHVRIGL